VSVAADAVSRHGSRARAGGRQARTRRSRCARDWDALLDAETCGHADVKAALARVLHLRALWPDGVKRYVASMYEMEPDAWERVAQFIDTATRSD